MKKLIIILLCVSFFLETKEIVPVDELCKKAYTNNSLISLTKMREEWIFTKDYTIVIDYLTHETTIAHNPYGSIKETHMCVSHTHPTHNRIISVLKTAYTDCIHTEYRETDTEGTLAIKEYYCPQNSAAITKSLSTIP